jgi:RNA polymerase sigma factor (sigma-70 family)
VAGIRAIQRELLAAGCHNQHLATAIERATRLEKQMFEANVRLAISIARKYRWSRIPEMDLIQESFTGLIKAIERFDFGRGIKFSTYATWWLRQSVTRAIADKERAIRVPVHMMEMINKLAGAARATGFDTAKAVPISQLSALTDMTDEEIRKTLSVVADATLWDDFPEDLDAVMSIADVGESPLAFAERTEMERIVHESVDRLQEREADVIKHRFGLLESGERTLEEVGQLYNLTRERIRQIEARALEKLRKPTNKIAVLEDYMTGCG